MDLFLVRKAGPTACAPFSARRFLGAGQGGRGRAQTRARTEGPSPALLTPRPQCPDQGHGACPLPGAVGLRVRAARPISGTRSLQTPLCCDDDSAAPGPASPPSPEAAARRPGAGGPGRPRDGLAGNRDPGRCQDGCAQQGAAYRAETPNKVHVCCRGLCDR